MRKFFIYIILSTFLANSLVPNASAQALMSKPGEMVALSPAFTPPLLKGVKVYANDPLRLDFIVDRGDERAGKNAQTDDVTRLIKYFLASLTVPRQDLWVNLSPYEKDRIVPEGFGQTEMGRDLLAQDYLLKQITASVIFPEGATGKAFWARIYKEAQEKFGTTDIPVDTFNKVWIIPAKADVFESPDLTGSGQGAAAYIVESRLKVLLESDYEAASHQRDAAQSPAPAGDEAMSHQRDAAQPPVPAGKPYAKSAPMSEMTKAIMREVVIPVLEKEVNEGRNFAQLRQVYNSLILATWYKRKIKQSLLSRVYVDRNKVDGVNIADSAETQKIWARYVEAFKTGAFNFIREEPDSQSGELIPRKYFSGGVLPDPAKILTVSTNVSKIRADQASLDGYQVRFDRAASNDNAEKLFPDEFVLSRKNSEGVTELRSFKFKTFYSGTEMLYMWRSMFKKSGLSLNTVVDDDVPSEKGSPIVVLLTEVKGANQELIGIAWHQRAKNVFKQNIPQLYGFQYVNGLDFQLTRALMAKVLSSMIYHNGPSKENLFIVQPNLKYKALFENPNGLAAQPHSALIDYSLPATNEDHYREKYHRITIAAGWKYIKETMVALENRNHAQSTPNPSQAAGVKGGIDLNPVDQTLRVDSVADGAAFNFDPAMINEYSQASGLVPVIVKVGAMDDLPGFLGIKAGAASGAVLP